MISSIISRVVILVFGTLYPAYASYKAVRTKNLKEYVKWMMYWIVFALFTCAETFTDVFMSWFPFYYEVKIVLVLWLLSPATRGSSILYRKFVHPALSRREQEIDDAISKAKEQGYHTVLNLGSKGVNYATNVIMQTAIRGGGGLVQQLKKSYSLSDLTEAPRPAGAGEDVLDEADDVLTDPRLIRRNVARSGYNTRRSASESNNRTPIYFSEVDVDMRSTRAATRGDMPDFSHIKSSEDISSGYSSAENSAALRGGAAGAADAADGASAGLARAGSVGAAARPRTRLAARTVTTIKRPGAAEGSEVNSEELEDDENFDFTDLPPLLNLPSSYHISHTNPPYLFEYVGNQIKIVQMLGDVSQCYFPEKKAIHMSQSESPVVEISSYNTSMTDGTVVDHNDKKEAIPEISPKDVPVLIIPINDKTVKDNIDKVVNIDQDVPIVPYYTAEEKFKIEQEKNKSEKIKDTFDQPLGYIDNISLLTVHSKHLDSVSSSSASLNSAKTAPSIKKENVDGEAASIETSSLDDIMVETDEEASYGTPDDSPKAKKKQEKRGKYGKSRAPPPPPDVKDDSKIVREQEVEDSNEKEKNYAGIRSLNNDSINKNVFAEPSVSKHALVQDSSYSVKLSEVSPSYGNIPERENKQKSPTGKKIKPSNSPITRLMQLPGKFVFWHKSEDKCKSDTWSTSSDELSRRSSTVDYISDEFQSCVDLQEATNMASLDDGQTENIPTITVFSSVDENTEKVATDITLTDVDLEESAIVKDIIDKSDALQKLIEAKLESHPEYKIIPLHDEEIPTTSKSTQV